jgi:DNA-binding protein H-NS
MATYLELKKQAEKLQEQAEEARKKEMVDAVEKVRQIMSDYNLTMRDVFGSATPSTKTRAKVAVKYRGPAGQEWSGRGRKPLWLAQALAEGKTIESFSVS